MNIHGVVKATKTESRWQWPGSGGRWGLVFNRYRALVSEDEKNMGVNIQ